MYNDEDLDGFTTDELAHLLEALEAGNAAVPPPQNAFQQMQQYPTSSYSYSQPPVLQHSFSNDPQAFFIPRAAFSASRPYDSSFDVSRHPPNAFHRPGMSVPRPFGISYQRPENPLHSCLANQCNMQNQRFSIPISQQPPAPFNTRDSPGIQRPFAPHFQHSAAPVKENINDENLRPPSIASNDNAPWTHRKTKTRNNDPSHDQMAHEMTTDYKYPLHANTGITIQFEAAQKNPPSGAQKNGVCRRIAKVIAVLIHKNAADVTLDDSSKVVNLRFFRQFFNDYEADISFTVTSNDHQGCESFFDSCNDLRLWGSNIQSITIEGKFTTKTLSTLTKTATSETTVVRLLHIQISGGGYTFYDWLSDIEKAYMIIADASCFVGSTFFDDCAAAVKWLNESTDHPASLTVITKSMCGPTALERLIQQHISRLGSGDTLNCYTTAPIYREIHDKLQQDHEYIPGPPLMMQDGFPSITAAYTYNDADYCSNFWFSGSQ